MFLTFHLLCNKWKVLEYQFLATSYLINDCSVWFVVDISAKIAVYVWKWYWTKQSIQETLNLIIGASETVTTVWYDWVSHLVLGNMTSWGDHYMIYMNKALEGFTCWMKLGIYLDHKYSGSFWVLWLWVTLSSLGLFLC